VLIAGAAEVAVQGAHEGVGQGAQLCGGDMGALCEHGGLEGDEVGCRDEGAVERGQQVLEGRAVEGGQHVQQVRHGVSAPGGIRDCLRAAALQRCAHAGGTR
jgi:hypothetical protein